MKKKILSVILALSLIINLIPIISFATDAQSPEQITGRFTSSSYAFSGEGDFAYDDNYFATDSYNYNHNLAKMSLRFAMSAFAANENGYDTQYKNAKELLEKLNFQNISHNKYYTVKPETNSIAVLAGSKKIRFGNEVYTIIATAIRGGRYEAEWGGNFNVGGGQLHEGFETARNQVLDFLKSYVADNKIQGNVKLWITGFSRGAATANLTSAYLDKDSSFFGEDVSLIPENIYTYCFETPAGVKNPPSDEVYNNIYSIVNPNDLVPKLVMEKWNYGRFGKTYYLPSEKANTNYETLKNQLYIKYNSHVKNQYKTENARCVEDFAKYQFTVSTDGKSIAFYLSEKVEKQNMEEFMSELADVLALTFENPTSYKNNQQEAFIHIAETIIGEEKGEEFLSILQKKATEEVKNYSMLDIVLGMLNEKALQNILYNAVKATFAELDIVVDDNTLNKAFAFLSEMLSKSMLETLIGNIDIIYAAHYPELCLAWLDITDETAYRESVNKKAESDEITVTLNGNKIVFDQPPVLQNDRTLVPLRAIFEALGATVDWDDASQTVTSVKDDTKVSLTIGSNTLYVNEAQITLDVPAQLVNGRTLVPVRAVAESFECKVDWDNDSRTVIITN